MFSITLLIIMMGYYMYQTYWRIPLGQLRQQIETNERLIESYLLEPYTGWNTLISHTPDKEKKYNYKCKKGCCRYEV